MRTLVAAWTLAAQGGLPEAKSLLKDGQAALAAGNYARALECGEKAAALFQGLQDPANEALAANLAGSAQLYRGEYAPAIEHYRRALALDRRQRDVKGEINRLTNIAGAQFFQGRYLDALDGYQTALRRADENGREPWSANRRQMALTNMAVLYEQLGQNQRALEYFRQALALGPALQASERGQLLSNLGTLYRRLGDAVKALETYREAQRLFASEHLSAFEIHVLQNVGIALTLDIGDARGANAAFTEALVKAEATSNRREIVLAHLFRGESNLREGRGESARADFAAALEGARAIGASEEQWTALYGLARLQRKEGRKEEALVTLREAIGIVEGLRSGLGASSLKAEFLGNKRDVYDAAIGLTLAAGAPAGDALFRLFEQARARNLQDALRGGGGPPSLAAAQSRLGDGMLIEYWMGDGKVAWLWATRQGWGTGVHAWGAEDDAAVKSLSAALRDGADGWRAQAERLGSMLLGGAFPETRQVTIVPDGVLCQVPFEVLAMGPGGPMLIEKVAVSYLPSAALLMRTPLPGTRMPPWRTQLAGFGDPRVDSPMALPGDEQWSRLPQSARELNDIARALPGRARIYAGAEDQKRYVFTGATSTATILHFATHAVADANDADRSRIFFTPQTGDAGSEYLFRAEAQGLRLSGVDLVTLSACDTESGKMVRGEGVQSFSRAFLAAGARSTVTTLWRVEDRATADFMGTFYRRLARGEGRAEALRAAKLGFLSQGGARAHPRYWASFVMNGESRAPIRPVFPWMGIALPAAAAVAAVIAFCRYRCRHHRLPMW